MELLNVPLNLEKYNLSSYRNTYLNRSEFLDKAFLYLKEEFSGMEGKAFIRSLFPGEKSWQRLIDHPYHYIMYVQTDMVYPIIWTSHSSKEPEESKEHSYIARLADLPILDFNNLLFLTTWHQHDRTSDMKALFNEANQSYRYNLAIEEVLSNTYGYIVYGHQLEQLYCLLTKASHAEAITFRKDWNMKRMKARQLAFEIKIDKDKSLLDLITDRSIDKTNHFAYIAAFHSTYRLLNLLMRGNTII